MEDISPAALMPALLIILPAAGWAQSGKTAKQKSAKARPASLHRGRRPRHGSKSETTGTWETRSHSGRL
ncbi:MAG: hypothetical protein HY922_07870 [Elusimicrobia bacterium]|nr:hypothetical protein [Elusimicrobiota bacterium]